MVKLNTTSKMKAGCAMRTVVLLTFGFLCVSDFAFSADDGAAAQKKTRHIGSEPIFGGAQAVVTEDVALFHTSQVLPLDFDGNLVGKNATEQASMILTNIGSLTNRLDSRDVARLVKLNLYVPNETVANELRPFLRTQFQRKHSPAFSLVQTRLHRPGALVTMDAVVIANRPDQHSVKEVSINNWHSNKTAILPRGPRVYISGQAEKGMDLADATAKTLQSLKQTLQHLGSEIKDVAHVKCFLTPMADVAKVEAEIDKWFAPHPVPPCVFVEWQSTLPIEIEMIATTRPNPESREPLEFITPPGMTASPVFCRVVRINDPRTIFVSGLFSREAGNGAAQVNDVFAQLQDILKASGSDLRHLAKATYYVSDDDASKKLNELRPKFYDPQRPPAASKAQVFGVGMAGRSLTLDMIAVPAK
jgi:enamine deaminase RidA (YjgF/YER057c/UK114 family)